MDDASVKRVESFLSTGNKFLQRQGFSKKEIENYKKLAEDLIAHPEHGDVSELGAILTEVRREHERRRPLTNSEGPTRIADSSTCDTELLLDDLSQQRSRHKDLTHTSRNRFCTDSQNQVSSALSSGSTKAEIARLMEKSRSWIGKQAKAAHARGIAGAIVHTAVENDCELDNAVLCPFFAAERPLCKEVLHKLEDIGRSLPRYRIEEKQFQNGLERLWDKSFQRVLRTQTDTRRNFDYGELSVVPTAALIFLFCSRWGRSEFNHVFKSTWNDTKTPILLKNGILRRQLAEAGSYCGQAEYQVEFLTSDKEYCGLKPADIEIASVMSYLSPSHKPDPAMLKDGDANRFMRSLLNDLDQSSKMLLGLACDYLTNGAFYCNAGQAMMFIVWGERICDYIGDVPTRSQLKSLRAYLQAIEAFDSKLALGDLASRVTALRDRIWKLCRHAKKSNR